MGVLGKCTRSGAAVVDQGARRSQRRMALRFPIQEQQAAVTGPIAKAGLALTRITSSLIKMSKKLSGEIHGVLISYAIKQIARTTYPPKPVLNSRNQPHQQRLCTHETDVLSTCATHCTRNTLGRIIVVAVIASL